MTPRLVKPRTAFVLAGGAALGAMLPALYQRRIVPDVLVGTSAGALNAAFVASLPAVNSRRVQPTDFSQSRGLIADAFAAARAALAAPAAPRRGATSLPAELAA